MKQFDPLRVIHMKETISGERLGVRISQSQNRLFPIVRIRLLIFDAFNIPDFIPYWEKHERD